MKLQDAYVAETGVYYGGWELISYSMPTSSNFTYDGYKGASAKTSITTEKKGAWTAQPKVTLNDCTTSAKWGINIAANTSAGGSVTYQAALTDQTNCQSLTPNLAAFSSDRTILATTVQ